MGVPSAIAPSTVMSTVPMEPVEQQASASNTSTDSPQLSISHNVRALSLQPPTRQSAVGGSGRLKPSPLHVSYTQPTPGSQMQAELPPKTTAQLPEAAVPPRSTDRGTEQDDFQFKVPTKAIRPSNTGTNDIQPTSGKSSGDHHIPHGQHEEVSGIGTTESSADDMEWNSNSAPNVVATSLPSQLTRASTTSPPPGTSSTITSGVQSEGGVYLLQGADTAGINSQVHAANLEHGQEAEYAQGFGGCQDTRYGQYSQEAQYGQGQMAQYGEGLAVYGQGQEPEAQGCRVEGKEAQYRQEGQYRQAQYRQGHEQEAQYEQAAHGQLGSGQEGQQYAQQPQDLQHEQQQHNTQEVVQQQDNQDFSNNQVIEA